MALGHHVRLMPAQYVKSYVKRGKNDATDQGDFLFGPALQLLVLP